MKTKLDIINDLLGGVIANWTPEAIEELTDYILDSFDGHVSNSKFENLIINCECEEYTSLSDALIAYDVSTLENLQQLTEVLILDSGHVVTINI